MKTRVKLSSKDVARDIPADLSDCVYGQIITEPVLSDGVIICNPGTPFTPSLKNKFILHGITTIRVEPIYGSIALLGFSINDLDNMVLAGLRVSDPNDVYRFASSLVKDAIDNKFSRAFDIFSKDDTVTIKHTMRVARLATAYAILAGIPCKGIKSILYGSLLHDIGKAYVPITILNKRGRLTKEEYETVKLHPQFGALWCRNVYKDFPEDVFSIILQHHENYDGSGYPFGLLGLEINNLASIVHIIDIFDAISSERPYKGPVSRANVVEYLDSQAGKMFSNTLWEKFKKTIPLYFVGEELKWNNITCIVSDTSNPDDPLVTVGKDILQLSKLDYAAYNNSEMNSITESLVLRV